MPNVDPHLEVIMRKLQANREALSQARDAHTATAAQAKRIAELEQIVGQLVEALTLCDGDGKRAMAIHAPEDRDVEALCERVGYGAVMDAAARLWFLKDRNGAITAGPCAATVRTALAAAQKLIGKDGGA